MINSPNEIIRAWWKSKRVRFDLFGRQKVSLLSPQFTYQNEYNKGDLQWVEKKVGGGDAEHDPTDATVKLTVAAAGDKIIRQTRKYLRYFSGKASQATMTFYTGEMDADTVFRAGYFDGDNGLFLERDDTTEYVVLRSGGVDQKVPRANWNRDKIRGFDFDKSVILQINIKWLGVGVGQVVIELSTGDLIVIHEFHGSGFVEETYMRTANLPMRYEFEAVTGFEGDPAEVKQICAAYGHENGSGAEISKYRHGVNNGISATSVTTDKRVILAIRPKAEFNGLTNRADLRPSDIDLLVGAQNIQWEVVYNPVLSGSVTWVSAGEESPVEYSINASAYTGGEIIRSGYAAEGSGNTRTRTEAAVQDNYPLGLDVDGDNPTILAVVARSFTGTATVSVSMGIEELY